ncbi:MAG: Swt1 family HEPN domain-containing protein [Bryobacteraceae bacterium]
MMDDQLYAFAFRGLLTEEALDRTGRQTRLTRSSTVEASNAKSVGLDLLDDAYVTRAVKMAPAYTAIAAFENSVREFVSKRLLEHAGETWWSECVSEKIRSKAESRRDEETKIRWHTPRGDDPINYTEFGDLTSIISQNWDQFEAHLRNQDWVRQIISTLERSRNVIMHSGDLASSDLERIGTVIRDWVKQVGA